MSKHLQRDVDELHRSLMSLFGYVEQMIDRCMQAFCERKLDLVDGIIAADRVVDKTEVEIEEECLKILALHQPVAGDLRQITTVLKINGELERIGDLACNIAKRARNVDDYFPIPDELPEMFRAATEMVRMSLDAFVGSSAELARETILRDEVVDDYTLNVIMELREMMKQDSTRIDSALHCFTAARQVERIADLAENIAEDVIYLVDGDIVRHRNSRYAKQTRARGINDLDEEVN